MYVHEKMWNFLKLLKIPKHVEVNGTAHTHAKSCKVDIKHNSAASAVTQRAKWERCCPLKKTDQEISVIKTESPLSTTLGIPEIKRQVGGGGKPHAPMGHAHRGEEWELVPSKSKKGWHLYSRLPTHVTGLSHTQVHSPRPVIGWEAVCVGSVCAALGDRNRYYSPVVICRDSFFALVANIW